jgi:transcriptional regulator with XRE-family HTH domain
MGPTFLNWRKRRGLSRQALADKIGCDQSAIRYWESGQVIPTVVNAARLATACGIQNLPLRHLARVLEECGVDLPLRPILQVAVASGLCREDLFGADL